MDKNYNFERKKLMLPEYGRHVHQMVDYLKTIHDRDLRNQQARAVIDSTLYLGEPTQQTQNGEAVLTAPATVNILYMDTDGALQSAIVRDQASCKIALGEGAVCEASVTPGRDGFAAPSGGGIDHERVHNEDFLIRRFKLPRRIGVYIDLYLIQNSGRRDASVCFRNEEIAARERSLRCGAHGIDPALPAGRGAPGFLFGVNRVIYGGHGVNIGRRGLSEGNWHGILLCLN